jgi:predicted PurR-regulated permease PerM
MLNPLRDEPPDDERPRPDLTKLEKLLHGPFDIRSVALTGLFILAAFYTFYFARAFILPIVLALLLNFLLSPAVRGLKRLRIPEPLGAGLVLAALLGSVGWGAYELAGPAYQWAEKAPASLRKLERQMRGLKKPVETVSQATEQVEKMTQVDGGAAPRKVEVQTQTLGQKVFERATDVTAGAVVTVILLFFLLASGDLFLRKLIRVLPSLEDKKRAVEIARQIERDVSTYLSTITMINVALGAALWGLLTWQEVPNPLLWGALAALLNYIPYLGAIVMMAVLTAIGFLTFDELGRALLVPGSFVALNLLEAYLVTPLVLGRRLTLNPVVIFLGLTFWGWLWGIAGALLAVPIMVVFKIFCDHSEPLAPIGEFMGGE